MIECALHAIVFECMYVYLCCSTFLLLFTCLYVCVLCTNGVKCVCVFNVILFVCKLYVVVETPQAPEDGL